MSVEESIVVRKCRLGVPSPMALPGFMINYLKK